MKKEEQKEAARTIKQLFDADQRERKSQTLRKLSEKKRWSIIATHDTSRRQKLRLILRQKNDLRGIDYFRAGIILQHGDSDRDIKEAKELARMSFEKGYAPGRWLYAAATDRLLMRQKKRQKFGTQFRKHADGWKLHPVDPMTTDSERRTYNVLPLAEIKKVEQRLNGGRLASSKIRSKIAITQLSHKTRYATGT